MTIKEIELLIEKYRDAVAIEVFDAHLPHRDPKCDKAEKNTALAEKDLKDAIIEYGRESAAEQKHDCLKEEMLNKIKILDKCISIDERISKLEQNLKEHGE